MKVIILLLIWVSINYADECVSLGTLKIVKSGSWIECKGTVEKFEENGDFYLSDSLGSVRVNNQSNSVEVGSVLTVGGTLKRTSEKQEYIKAYLIESENELLFRAPLGTKDTMVISSVQEMKMEYFSAEKKKGTTLAVLGGATTLISLFIMNSRMKQRDDEFNKSLSSSSDDPLDEAVNLLLMPVDVVDYTGETSKDLAIFGTVALGGLVTTLIGVSKISKWKKESQKGTDKLYKNIDITFIPSLQSPGIYLSREF